MLPFALHVGACCDHQLEDSRSGVRLVWSYLLRVCSVSHCHYEHLPMRRALLITFKSPSLSMWCWITVCHHIVDWWCDNSGTKRLWRCQGFKISVCLGIMIYTKPTVLHPYFSFQFVIYCYPLATFSFIHLFIYLFNLSCFVLLNLPSFHVFLLCSSTLFHHSFREITRNFYFYCL